MCSSAEAASGRLRSLVSALGVRFQQVWGRRVAGSVGRGCGLVGRVGWLIG